MEYIGHPIPQSFGFGGIYMAFAKFRPIYYEPNQEIHLLWWQEVFRHLCEMIK